MTDIVAAADSQLPKWFEFVAPILRLLDDGETWARRDIFAKLPEAMGISDSARLEKVESGLNRFSNRASWGLTHLNKASWVEQPARAAYRITEAGRAALVQFPDGLTAANARKVMAPFWVDDDTTSAAPAVPKRDAIVDESDPIEQIETAFATLREGLEAELLDLLRKADPAFFEQVVVELLLAMGYGGAEQRGKRVGGTADGGIDGVIDEDALGLERIHIQAKRYAEGNNVGRETLQAFIGALAQHAAAKGVFITTSAFTPHARSFAENIPNRLVLIDGRRLVDLMLRYRVGVQVRRSFEHLEVDSDYFE